MKLIEFPFQGTVPYPVGTETIDLKAIAEKVEAAHSERMLMMAKTFSGIRVIVDDKLEGLNYYLCVSQKLLEELQKAEAAATAKEKARK